MKKNQYSVFLLLLPLFFLGGCIINFNRTEPAKNAGIFKSIDSGKIWNPKVQVPMVGGQTASIINVNTLNMITDPQDPLALYLATPAHGMWFTYNGGEAWFHAKTAGREKINDIAVNPIWKCTLYMVSGAEVFKSSDCSRSWESVYVDPRKEVEIERVAIDPSDPERIYVGTTLGDLLLSLDGGISWQTNFRFSGAVKRLIIDPRDSNLLYVLLDRGFWKSNDKGLTWVDLTKKIAPFQRAAGLRDIIFDFSESQALYVTLGYGIIRTHDGGENWESLSLTTPPSSVIIRGIAVNPQNGNEIYYGVGNKIYKSIDKGISWEPSELPTLATITNLLIDSKNPAILYASLFYVEPKK